MVDKERLALEFVNLVKIESPSKKEGALAHYIADIFEALGYRCFFDKSAEATGSEVGNLIVKIPGSIPAPPVFFCAHMDTVGPCESPEVIFEDGIFRTDGRTILGADDKAAIAILIEVAKIIKDNTFAHPPVEFIFTTCEEIGLLGAKSLDTSLIDAKEGFVLDSENPWEVIIGAPSSYRFTVKVKGISAHAGLEPEKGVNAVHVLSQIISKLPTGRIDEETTMNIGIVKGGEFVNIVPEEAFAEGEIRSHQEFKLEELQKLIADEANNVAKTYPFRKDDFPKVFTSFEKIYTAFYIPPDDPLCKLVKKAAEGLGLNITFKRKEGASDANVLNEKGLKSLILGIGMQKVHTTEEYIALKDMIITAHLILEVLHLKSESHE